MASNYTFTDNGVVYDMQTLFVQQKFFSDGGWYAWGDNSNSAFFNGNTVSSKTPLRVATSNIWRQIAGLSCSFGIAVDNSLWACGYNTFGALGLGNTSNRSSPVRVGSLNNWSKIFVGSNNASVWAIKTDGTLWSWGVNSYGQLGLGDTIDRSSPVQVGSLSNWAQLASGSLFMVAIKTDGTLWACGYNGQGGLGQNDVTHRSSPVQVGSLSNWAQVAANSASFLAVKTDGTLWACGGNGFGELGLGLTPRRSSPTQVGSLTNWAQVSCSDTRMSSAIKTDGTLWTWGANSVGIYNGQLGLGDVVDRTSPVQVGNLTNWKQVSSGYSNTIAVKTDGSLWSWGVNDAYGVLGLGDTTARSSPVQVGTSYNWKEVSVFHGYTAKALQYQ